MIQIIIPIILLTAISFLYVRKNNRDILQNDLTAHTFKLFELRDEVLWLAINGHISEDEAVQQYNQINWAIRYVKQYPIFFVFGLIITLKKLELLDIDVEQIKERFKNEPAQVRKWYAKFGELINYSITNYTPLGVLNRHPFLAKMPGFGNLMLVYCLIGSLTKYKNHPIMITIREELGIVESSMRQRISQEQESLKYANQSSRQLMELSPV